MITLEQVQQKVSHGTFRVPWLTLILSVFVGILHIAGPTAFQFFVFDKVAILRGEIWRFFTGHFVHFGFDHFIWDFIALIILGCIIELIDPKRLAGSLFTSCTAVSFWLMLGNSGTDTYCGLSGALSGLLVVAAISQYRLTNNKTFLWALFLTLAKILFEWLFHTTIFVTSVTGISSAHAVGFVAGAVYVAVESKNISLISNYDK